MNLSVSRFVRSCHGAARDQGRFSGRACRCPQGGQIFQHWRPIWTHCGRDLSVYSYSMSARQLLWLWQKDFPVFRGSQRDELSLNTL